MAAKRLRDEADDRDSDPSSDDKRTRTVPSISTVVVREALTQRPFQSFAVALEPLLRRVVNEEVARGLVQGARSLQRSTSMRQIQAAETTTLRLIFSSPLSLPIFTGSRITDNENNPLRVLLVDCRSGCRSLVSLPSALRVDIVALDGDFPGKRETWSSAEFERSIVKERTGRRPLVTGDVLLTLRDGSATIGDLTFTDNSSWIRSRHFRLGARVAPGSCSEGLRIKEAMTEPFMVKDHRGELYKKHYPPTLQDEVWRLERIGKEGVFHQKLRAEGINTVQEFLKLWVVDPARLRNILGQGMSDRVWEGTIGHAKTCDMGSKLYLHRSPHGVLVLSPICQVQGLLTDGRVYPAHGLHGPQQVFLRQLAREAYEHWDQLEEVDEMFARAAWEQQSKALPQIAIEPSPPSAITFHTTNQGTPTSTYRSGGFDLEALQGNVESVEFSWVQSPGGAVMHQSNHVHNHVSELSSSEDDEEEEDANPTQGFPGGRGSNAEDHRPTSKYC